MKTQDEIKKWMECCTHGTCNSCPYFGDECDSDREVIDTLEYIQHLEHQIGELTEKVAQLEAAQPKWISVEERLPEDDVDVLVYIASKKENVDSVIAITHYTHRMHGLNIECWCSPWQYCFWDREVTHWMPLPSMSEPPKEDA